MPEPDKTRIHAFETPAAFWQWLELNHNSEPELWLKIFKKSSGQKSITWEAAYAPPSEMTIPDDFLAALEERPKAKAFFETLNRQNQYAIAYRLQTAKRPATRQKRFGRFLEMLENEEKLY